MTVPARLSLFCLGRYMRKMSGMLFLGKIYKYVQNFIQHLQEYSYKSLRPIFLSDHPA
jgi:hypothetical protein